MSARSGAAASTAGGEAATVAAFFDLDKTVIAKAAMAALRGPLHDGGLINRRALVRAFFAELVYLHLGADEKRLARVREVVLALSRGWSRAQVQEVVEDALERVVDPLVYSEAVDLIEEHRDAGHVVVIVSASPAEVVVPLARHLGVTETIASTAAVDEDGRYTGEMAFYAYGPYKAEALRERATSMGVDLARSYAYSDSYTDLPMLESVGHPVAVNPDRVLGRIAREREWEIRHFVSPVRLRDRVRDQVTLRPAVAVSLGALLLGAGALALGWWLGSRPRATGSAVSSASVAP